ncbi:MAG: hypothetical protein L6R35_000151 [Caloplaca aegaea]|nr:MAG: hypothetical protein L6R35_000151 [Caloplaca aegaea]
MKTWLSRVLRLIFKHKLRDNADQPYECIGRRSFSPFNTAVLSFENFSLAILPPRRGERSTMAAALSALNAKIRSHPYLNYLCSTHFWGPVSNFGIPIAAIADIQKDPELISGRMTSALTLYSATFMRYSMAVSPKNYLLFACHLINFGSQSTQGVRFLKYWKQRGGKGFAKWVAGKKGGDTMEMSWGEQSNEGARSNGVRSIHTLLALRRFAGSKGPLEECTGGDQRRDEGLGMIESGSGHHSRNWNHMLTRVPLNSYGGREEALKMQEKTKEGLRVAEKEGKKILQQGERQVNEAKDKVMK